MRAAKITLLSTILSFTFSCSKTENSEPEIAQGKQEIVFPKGQKVPNDKFVGNVYQAILSDEGTRISNVTFEPKGRTNWHNHPGGQTLLVTDGIGYHQEEGKPIQIIKKGDVIKIGKNVKHWHGGSAENSMTHIAVSIDHEKNPSQWFEAVSEEDYNRGESDK